MENEHFWKYCPNKIVVFHSYVTNDQRLSASRPWPVVSARFGPFPGRLEQIGEASEVSPENSWWSCPTAPNDNHIAVYDISWYIMIYLSLQLQTPSETVFGVGFWNPNTFELRVSGALGLGLESIHFGGVLMILIHTQLGMLSNGM